MPPVVHTERQRKSSNALVATRPAGYLAGMSHVHYELDGKTAVIQMDDGKANALSYDMIDGVLEALARAENEASAIVLAGRP